MTTPPITDEALAELDARHAAVGSADHQCCNWCGAIWPCTFAVLRARIRQGEERIRELEAELRKVNQVTVRDTLVFEAGMREGQRPQKEANHG